MKGNQVALWAGVAAFFGTLLAVGAIDILNPSAAVQYISALFTAGITSGAVYSKQRLDDAKEGRIRAGTINIAEVGDKRVFTLELDHDPVMFEDKKEVIFGVRLEQRVGEE